MNERDAQTATELEQQISKQRMEAFNDALIEELAVEMLKDRFNFSGKEGIAVPDWMQEVANESVHRYIEYLKLTQHARPHDAQH
jgi:hypothetical protein